jgi:hypothetical protein
MGTASTQTATSTALAILNAIGLARRGELLSMVTCTRIELSPMLLEGLIAPNPEDITANKLGSTLWLASRDLQKVRLVL